MSLRAFVNGRIVAGTALIAAGFADRGFTAGDGLLEVLRVRRRRIELLGEHADRIWTSGRTLGYALPASPAPFADFVRETVAANGGGDGLYHLYVTRGPLAHALDPRGEPDTTVVVAPAEAEPLDATTLAEGLRVEWATFPRNEDSPLARIKSVGRLEAALARSHARERGGHEALFLNTQGRVAGGAASSLFVLDGRGVVTPPVAEGAFPGILRRTLLVAARSLGLPAVETPVSRDEIAAAADLFLTSSALGIAGIAAVAGRTVPAPPGRSIVPRLRLRVHELSEQERLPAMPSV